MKNKRFLPLIRFSCVVLILVLVGTLVFHVSGNARYFEGDAEDYYQSLVSAGFPEDYAVALTELHLLHPTWEFVPLLVTKENEDYTWDYVIYKEIEDPSNNLIGADESYIPYRHPLHAGIYDAGSYPASVDAVRYFMDPRNFLNETDIFQFYDLTSGADTTLQAVEAILESTFMENAVLENGSTYATYFLELGEELGISPLYLAVKARQEQGVNGTSPVIGGACGTLLNDYYQNNTQYSEAGNAVLAPSDGHSSSELLALDGYYNIYNVNASGNGLFSIYYNAMKRAQSGTDALADTWGSPSWDTVWKSIYGGAYTIKASYIDRYQNTVYLQKFNVDSRSDRNFWGQYMQNVGGALTEGRTLYTSFASVGALDSTCRFVIPVYEGMPISASPDPANGNCSYLAAAPQKYTYTVSIEDPVIKNETGSAIYMTQRIASGGILEISGEVSHSYGVAGMEYQWDGNGEWIPFSNDGMLALSLPVDFSEGTSHILVIRGCADYRHNVSAKKSNYNFLCAVIYVDVVETPKAKLTLQNGESSTTITLAVGTEFYLPDADTEQMIGWNGSDDTLLPASSAAILQEDITYQSLYLTSERLDGAALILSEGAVQLRFSAVIEQSCFDALQALPVPQELYAVVTANGESMTLPVYQKQTVRAYDRDWMLLYADTEPLDKTDFETAYSVSFYAKLTYSDGSERCMPLSNTPPSARSAIEVASAALADTEESYSPTLQKALQSIVSSTKS